jgi:hypothetical protein
MVGGDEVITIDLKCLTFHTPKLTPYSPCLLILRPLLTWKETILPQFTLYNS